MIEFKFLPWPLAPTPSGRAHCEESRFRLTVPDLPYNRPFHAAHLLAFCVGLSPAREAIDEAALNRAHASECEADDVSRPAGRSFIFSTTAYGIRIVPCPIPSTSGEVLWPCQSVPPVSTRPRRSAAAW